MKPILKKLLDTVAWWGPYSPLTGFAYNFKTGQYMRRGQQIAIGTAVTEGRSTDAYVLDGDGNYVLRSANEPAQANGHGLDGFDEAENLLLTSDDYSTYWSLGNVTLTTNDKVSVFGGRLADKFVAAPGAANAGGFRNPLDMGEVIASKTLQASFIVYSDTAFTGTVRIRGTGATQEAENMNVSVSVGWSRVTAEKSFTGAADGSDIYIAFIPDFGSSPGRTWWQSNADVTIGDVVYPPILTTGSVGTRAADDTRVAQGQRQEPVINGDFATGDLTGWTAGGVDSALVSVVSEEVRIEGNAFVSQQLATEAGVTYAFLGDITSASVPVNELRAGTTVGAFDVAQLTGLGIGSHVLTFVATGSITWVSFKTQYAGGSANFTTFDTASVKAATLAPGFTTNPDELTFRVDWDGVAVGTGADRVLFQVKNTSNRFVSLLIDSSDDLRWGGDQTGSFQSLDAGGTFDDGGAHTAVCYFNRTTSELKLSVDGAAPITGTLTGAVPSNLDEMAISRTATGTGNNANGTDCRIQTSDGNFFEAFRDSSAGFF